MASITIRNLDEETKSRLRIQLLSLVAALPAHVEEPAGGEPRVLRESLDDKRNEGIDHARSLLSSRPLSVLLDHTFDDAVVTAELSSDSPNRPLLDVVKPEDLGFDFWNHPGTSLLPRKLLRVNPLELRPQK